MIAEKFKEAFVSSPHNQLLVDVLPYPGLQDAYQKRMLLLIPPVATERSSSAVLQGEKGWTSLLKTTNVDDSRSVRATI